MVDFDPIHARIVGHRFEEGVGGGVGQRHREALDHVPEAEVDLGTAPQHEPIGFRRRILDVILEDHDIMTLGRSLPEDARSTLASSEMVLGSVAASATTSAAGTGVADVPLRSTFSRTAGRRALVVSRVAAS
ncbi:MAG: hypothetical protein R3E48_20890 [Burkholderiaceae bacterium]